MRSRSAAGATLFLAAVAAALGCGGRPQPSVLLLVMNSTRADRCSFLGYARPTTPRLAEFAKGAAVFTDAWSPSGWTAEAHASLFTGLRPEHLAMRTSEGKRLAEHHVTLAERLQAAGYRTALFSHSDAVKEEAGLTQGFEHVEALYHDTGQPYPWAAATHARAATWAEEAHARGSPFLLVVVDTEPAMPYTPPADLAHEFVRGDPAPGDLREARAFGPPRDLTHDLGVRPFTPEQLALMSDLYDAEIATLDREIGRLFDRLRAKGLLESMVVVVTGDHGVGLGDHGLVGHAFGLHRSICRVPLLVRIPGRFDLEARVDSVVRLEDLLPTILEACGAPPAEEVDGESLTRDLAGRTARGMLDGYEDIRKMAEYLAPGISSGALYARVESVYDGSLHYIGRAGHREELYDVVADPAERRNLAAERPADLARMRALLQATGR